MVTKLELSAQEQALVVPRGAFYQSTGGSYIYVLTDEGEAVKRTIELGAQNPTHIKVRSGLSEGDRVITSSYTGFGEAERIVIE